MLGAVEPINLTADQVFPSSNQLTAIFTGRGTGKNGKQVVFERIDVFEINQDETIQIMWGDWTPSRWRSCRDEGEPLFGCDDRSKLQSHVMSVRFAHAGKAASRPRSPETNGPPSLPTPL